MSGSFSSFNTGLSALRYNQVLLDVASGNIANSSTAGYARRRVEGDSVGAPAQVAMWSRYVGAGDGVKVNGISRLVDPLLDARARTEHSQPVLPRPHRRRARPRSSPASASPATPASPPR